MDQNHDNTERSNDKFSIEKFPFIKINLRKKLFSFSTLLAIGQIFERNCATYVGLVGSECFQQWEALLKGIHPCNFGLGENLRISFDVHLRHDIRRAFVV
jgi:hypothetical protein